MSVRAPSLFARDDTMLGVCQGLGEDFGFNPIWLRAAFAVVFFFNPAVVIGVYVALAALVLVSRLTFPSRRKVIDTEPAVLNDAPVKALTDAAEPEFALAA